MVVLGIITLMVHTEDHRDVLVLGGSADDDLFRPGFEVLGGPLPVTEDPRRLNDHVDPEVPPGKGARIPLAENADLVAIHHEPGIRHGDLARVGTVHRVVAEQMRQSVAVCQVVDGHEVQSIGAALDGGA